MKYSTFGALAGLHVCLAFPADIFERTRDGSTREADAKAAAEYMAKKRQLPGVTPPFDAEQQYVSNTGLHAFVTPSGSDQRGPCPGLNAMANHGYFPHNGVGGFSDFVDGTAAVFGMGADLAGFLAVYGVVFDGDLVQYSIGGPVAGLLNLGGLLGQPEGLSGSHNKYEGDVSPIRGDLYVYGNDYLNQVSQFAALYQLGQENGDNVDLDVLTNYRVTRFQESVTGNPYFFNAPFSGVVASPAAWSFIYRFMANKSSEYPEGVLTGEVLKSFYAMTGDYPDFTYTAGHERVPDNWYKRNIVDYYTIPYFALDTAAMVLEHPQFASLGGNVGQVNTFAGIDPTNLTGGVYNLEMLTEGNNGLCYGFEVYGQQLPDILTGLFSDIDQAMDLIGPYFTNISDSLGCPKLNSINKEQFSKYPGYANLKSDGTYSK